MSTPSSPTPLRRSIDDVDGAVREGAGFDGLGGSLFLCIGEEAACLAGAAESACPFQILSGDLEKRYQAVGNVKPSCAEIEINLRSSEPRD
jgi:hypothetical protein